MQHWNAEVLGKVMLAVNETFPAQGLGMSSHLGG
jgi:hypothetical protein